MTNVYILNKDKNCCVCVCVCVVDVDMHIQWKMAEFGLCICIIQFVTAIELGRENVMHEDCGSRKMGNSFSAAWMCCRCVKCTFPSATQCSQWHADTHSDSEA